MNVRLAKARMNVVEVPSFEHARIYGTGNLKAPRDGWRVLRTIVRERLRRSGARAPASFHREGTSESFGT